MSTRNPPSEPFVPPTLVHLTRYDDAVFALQHPSCSRVREDKKLSALLRAMQADAPALLTLTERNLLAMNGDTHRTCRKSLFGVLSAISDRCPEQQIAQIFKDMLNLAVQADMIDIHKDLSERLVCQIIGAHFNVSAEIVLKVSHLAMPLLTSHLSIGSKRLQQIKELAGLADQLDDLMVDLLSDGLAISDMTDEETRALISIGLIAPSAMVPVALSGAIGKIMHDCDLADRVRQDSRQLGDLVLASVADAVPRYTGRMLLSEDAVLPSGVRLEAGRMFVCDIHACRITSSEATHKLPPKTGLSFGAGPHRCAGAALSLQIVTQAIKTLTNGFTITPIEGLDSSSGLCLARVQSR